MDESIDEVEVSQLGAVGGIEKDQELKAYIGTKILLAKPMAEIDWMKEQSVTPAEGETLREGYLVIYDNGYKAWSPKDVFDTHYRLLTNTEKSTVNY